MVAATRYIDVNSDGLALIECPACGRKSPSGVNAFKGVTNVVSVYCGCGDFFEIALDFRKARRVDVGFTGYYSMSAKPKSWSYMKVTNVSMGGISITLVGVFSVKENDELQVEFTLDDFPPSAIKKKVVVKSVRGNTLGCKFVEPLVEDDPVARYLFS
jgi:hypothetical protein